MYTDLSDTRLYLRLRLLRGDGSELDQNVAVAPVNMLFHALFRKVDVFLGGRLITQSSDTYPWKAAIETLLNFGKDAKESQLHSIFYHRDMPNANGMTQRRQIAQESKRFELYGPLHVDMFVQEKYLLSEMPIRIVLTRSTPAFVLHSTEPNANFKIDIQQAILFVRRVKVSPSIELAHAKALQRSNALYPLHRSEIEVVPIGSGVQVLTKDNLFNGRVPKKMVLAFLTSNSFNGSYADSPFRFLHQGVHRIDITLDGEPVADTPLSCDFDNGLYMRAYQGLFNAMNRSYADFGTDITFADFKNMYSLFCFDLTSDACGNSTNHFELERKGHLRLVAGFGAVQQTIYAIIYGEFESTLEITKEREVLQG